MFFLTNYSYSIQALIMGLFTWFITTLGSSLVFFFKKVSSFLLNLMMGLSAGIMLSASFWSLLNPAIEDAKSLGMNSWLVVSLGFVIGCIFLYLCLQFFQK